MQKLGAAIIGSGWVAGEYIRAFTTNPSTELRAICSRTKEGAQAKAQEFGVPCDVYTDYEKMAARDDIDIVVVASPPNLHKDHAVAVAQAGKHLILEKPMAINIDDCRTIRDAVAKAGVKSVISFVLRWNPLYEIIKSLITDNAIGDVFLGEVDYFHGVGPWYKLYSWNVKREVGGSSLLAAGCHALDGLRWFMGGEVAEVCQYSTFGKAFDFKEYEYDPTTCTLVKFADGRIGKVTSCIECTQPYVFNINLVGTLGTIKNNLVYSKQKFPGQTGWATIPTVLPDSGDVTHHPFSHEVAHLLDCIAANRESHCNAADAFISHEVCLAADRSGLEGKPVKLPLK